LSVSALANLSKFTINKKQNSTGREVTTDYNETAYYRSDQLF